MKIILLDSSTNVMVDSLAIILGTNGWEAKAAHTSAEAIEWVPKFKPDWVFTILNNIIDANAHDVVLQILRLHPSCKFFLTAGHPMPAFEHKLWEGGYALRNVLPLPVHPRDMLDLLKNGESMVAAVKEGQAPKFTMFRGNGEDHPE